MEMVKPTLSMRAFSWLIVDQRTGQICVLSSDLPEVIGSSIVTAGVVTVWGSFLHLTILCCGHAGYISEQSKGLLYRTGTEAVFSIWAGEGEAMCSLPSVIPILLSWHGKRRAIALDLDHLIKSYPQFQITIISL